MADGYAYVLPPLLAQGSRPPNRQLPFDVVVLCAVEAQDLPVKARVIRAPLDDSGPPPTKDEVKIALVTAARVAELVQARRRVLVTCHKGYNRSGLVTGLALVNLGYSADQATKMIRFARGPVALSNIHFRHLLILHERGRRRSQRRRTS